MNRAKLFLTAIGVFAIVGGALAFKATSAFQTIYCTTTAADTGCSEQRSLTPHGLGTSYYYVIKGAGACNAIRTCNTVSAKFIGDD